MLSLNQKTTYIRDAYSVYYTVYIVNEIHAPDLAVGKWVWGLVAGGDDGDEMFGSTAVLTIGRFSLAGNQIGARVGRGL